MRKRSQKNSPLMSYLVHHLRVFISSMGHLSRQPVATLMTSAVLAIALALPTSLYVLLNNAGGLSAGWDSSTRISLFLHTKVTAQQATKLAQRLRLHKQIDHISMIDKDQGLALFRKLSGFGDSIQYLDANPLPIVLNVQPIVEPEHPEKIAQLLSELKKEKQVELAQLDMQWVKRLYTLLEIAHRGIWVIASLLGLAVLLIIGNTIRLDILSRRPEIEVAKLIGASNAFIRRPFLYTGLWYGLCGGVLAWILTALALGLLDDPVQRLAGLYQSTFQLTGLTAGDVLKLLGIACALGLAGSWLAVGRHLSQIEPS